MVMSVGFENPDIFVLCPTLAVTKSLVVWPISRRSWVWISPEQMYVSMWHLTQLASLFPGQEHKWVQSLNWERSGTPSYQILQKLGSALALMSRLLTWNSIHSDLMQMVHWHDWSNACEASRHARVSYIHDSGGIYSRHEFDMHTFMTVGGFTPGMNLTCKGYPPSTWVFWETFFWFWKFNYFKCKF
jgi:hypothetical protein